LSTRFGVVVDALNPSNEGSGILRRLDARAKLLSFIGLAVIVVTTPAREVWAFGAYAIVLALLVGLSRLSPGYFFKRLLVVIPFVVVVAVFVPFFGRAGSGGYSVGTLHLSTDGLAVLWNVVAKATLSVSSMIILAGTTSFPEMLEGLQRLRVPRVFVLIVSFMYRYSFVFADELERMQKAMAARNYRARWLWNVPTLGHVLASLFLRSFNRGERVYVAMLSRGYDGRISLAVPTPFGGAECLFLALTLAAALAVRVTVAL
jgi:cobalt/nickel transport system permease protein